MSASTSPQVTETFAVGAVPGVRRPRPPPARRSGEEAEPPGRITFLKEQQWKTDFATGPGGRARSPGRRARDRRDPPGRGPRGAGHRAGRRAASRSPPPAPLLGMPVKQGAGARHDRATRRAAATDRATLAADVGRAAGRGRRRARRARTRAAPRRRPGRPGEGASTRRRTRLQVAEARLAGATRPARAVRRERGRRRRRSPVPGALADRRHARRDRRRLGRDRRGGRAAVHVIDLDRVWLVAQVFEPDVPRVEHAPRRVVHVEGYDQPFTVDATNGTLVTVGRVVDPKTRTVPVIFELDNPAGRLRIGNFAKVVIATGAPRAALAIPEAAIVDDAGTAGRVRDGRGRVVRAPPAAPRHPLGRLGRGARGRRGRRARRHPGRLRDQARRRRRARCPAHGHAH